MDPSVNAIFFSFKLLSCSLTVWAQNGCKFMNMSKIMNLSLSQILTWQLYRLSINVKMCWHSNLPDKWENHDGILVIASWLCQCRWWCQSYYCYLRTSKMENLWRSIVHAADAVEQCYEEKLIPPESVRVVDETVSNTGHEFGHCFKTCSCGSSCEGSTSIGLKSQLKVPQL